MAILELEKKVSLVSICHHAFPSLHYLGLPVQFLSKFSPLYERRAEIIAGKVEPTDAEVEEGKAADSDVDDDDEDDEEGGSKITEMPEGDKQEGGEDVQGIPAFWLTALRNHTAVSETIEEHDEPVSLSFHYRKRRIRAQVIRLSKL